MTELKERVIAARVPAERVTVIPNGIDPDAFYPVDRIAARARLQIPINAQIVLSVGRLHQSKGHALLVECVGRLAPKLQDLHAYIVGSPYYEADARPAIWEAASRYGIADRIHLVGPQPHESMKYWYSAADVFVCRHRVRVPPMS